MSDYADEARYPFAQHLGMEMHAWSEGYARFALPVAPVLMNRHGTVHGGVHGALLDTAMGYAGCWTGDPERPQMCLTLTLNVQYLSRPKGMTLFADARKTGGGRSTFFAEGTITDDTGDVIAKGTGTFRYRSR